MSINQEGERTPMKGVECSNLGDKTLKGQEIQRTRAITCSNINDEFQTIKRFKGQGGQ